MFHDSEAAAIFARTVVLTFPRCCVAVVRLSVKLRGAGADSTVNSAARFETCQLGDGPSSPLRASEGSGTREVQRFAQTSRSSVNHHTNCCEVNSGGGTQNKALGLESSYRQTVFTIACARQSLRRSWSYFLQIRAGGRAKWVAATRGKVRLLRNAWILSPGSRVVAQTGVKPGCLTYKAHINL